MGIVPLVQNPRRNSKGGINKDIIFFPRSAVDLVGHCRRNRITPRRSTVVVAGEDRDV